MAPDRLRDGVRGGWWIWFPTPTQQEGVWIASLYIFAGCALFASAAWSHLCGSPIWVSVCVGRSGIFVGCATLKFALTASSVTPRRFLPIAQAVEQLNVT